MNALLSAEELSSLGGNIANQIILNAFIVNPENPFPSITAPVYLKGNTPAKPKTAPPANELEIP